MVGAMSVPLFRGDLSRRHVRLMARAQVELAFVNGPVELQSLLEHREQLSSLRRIIVLDEVATGSDGQQTLLESVVPDDASDWIM